MVEDAVDEISVCGKAGVVPIVDVSAGDRVAPRISALPRTAGLHITTVGQKLVPDVTILGHPEAQNG
jgi:hypothetical protein